MNFMEKNKERKAKSVLHLSLGVTAMSADSISVASHNSLLWKSELHYSSFEKCDSAVFTTLVNF